MKKQPKQEKRKPSTKKVKAHLPPDNQKLLWIDPVTKTTDVSHWHVWWTKCKRYRVVRSVSKYDNSLSTFYAGYGFHKNLGDFETLSQAIDSCEAYHLRRHPDVESEEFTSNKLLAVALAIEKSLDRLPDRLESSSPVLRKARPLTEPIVGEGRTLFGYDPLAIIRWLGRDGCLVEQAIKVLSHMKVSFSRSVIRFQLKAGTEGVLSTPELTEDEASELYEIMKG